MTTAVVVVMLPTMTGGGTMMPVGPAGEVEIGLVRVQGQSVMVKVWLLVAV